MRAEIQRVTMCQTLNNPYLLTINYKIMIDKLTNPFRKKAPTKFALRTAAQLSITNLAIITSDLYKIFKRLDKIQVQYQEAKDKTNTLSNSEDEYKSKEVYYKTAQLQALLKDILRV